MPSSLFKGVHSAASLSKLTARRKAKIQELADREAESSKRSRLISLLTQKLVAKYGTRMKSSTNGVIKRTVKEFLSKASHISESDLKQVEGTVKKVRTSCCWLMLLLLSGRNASTLVGDFDGYASLFLQFW